MSIAFDLRQEREKRQMTQKQLAKKSGLSISYISELENFKYKPTYDTIILLCIAFEITPNQFFNWDSLSKMENLKQKISSGELY